MTRYLITVTCYGAPDKYNTSPLLWSETAYRNATSPKRAAISAGMPASVRKGRREQLGRMTTAAYLEAPEADRTRKTWVASQQECHAAR